MPRCRLDKIDIGSFIAEGKFRKIYEYKKDPSFVIKVNKPFVKINNYNTWLKHNSNLDEYNNFKILKKLNLEHWVAECKYFSNSLLLMKKAEPVSPGVYQIPSFFKDLSSSNFGMISSRIVCVDYSWLLSKESGYKIEGKFFKSVTDMAVLKNFTIVNARLKK